jgi:predicted nucleotidyltransferase
MNTSPTVNQAVLDEIIRRIVEVAAPDRIILFGSAARGKMGPHSDLDLLVIKSGDFHRRNLAKQIYKNIRDVDYAVDIVVVTSQDVEKYRDSHALVIKPALQEGRVIYDAA